LEDEETVEHMCATSELNAKNWIFTMLETLPSMEFVRILVTLWAVWTARRKAIHEGEFQSPLSTHFFVRKFLNDLTLIPKSGPLTHNGRHQHTVVPRWKPPADGHVKANVDGAVSKNNSKGSAAVVIRNREGHYLGSSAIVLSGVINPPTLQALACREALSLAEDLGLPRVCIASDCKQVVDDIAEDSGGRYASIIKEIKVYRSEFEKVIVVHEGRKSNTEAHNLARFALSLDLGRHLWLLAPYDPLVIPVLLNIE
jgi:ribonuclease HI